MTTPAKKPFDAEMPENVFIRIDNDEDGYAHVWEGESHFPEQETKYTRSDRCVPRADVAKLVSVLRDAVSGLQYIEMRYGKLDGVGFDRVYQAEAEALAEFKNTYGVTDECPDAKHGE